MKRKHRLTTEDFIKRAKEVHGDKYDYSQTEYFGKFKKLKIICPIHGEFEQEAWGHLKGRGCVKCSGFEPLTTEIFIKKAKEIHGNKYDYSKTIYISRRKFVTIICPTHGEFSQRADGHLTNRGCKKCVGFERTKEEYIQEAIKIHGNKYDYSQMEYSPQLRQMKIICKKHGEFKVLKSHHINPKCKYGCPICSDSKGENEINMFLKKNNINFIPQKTFAECKDKQVLQFDFYIPEINTCIEYDGKQHFEPISCFGGIKAFRILKRHDEIKNKFCLDNNILLYRISYKENIQEKLLQLFPLF